MQLTVLLMVDSRRTGWMTDDLHTIIHIASTCIVIYIHVNVFLSSNYIPWRGLFSAASTSHHRDCYALLFCIFVEFNAYLWLQNSCFNLRTLRSCFWTSSQTNQCWLIRPHSVSLGVALWNTNSKCQPGHHRDSPVFCVPAALQGADYRFKLIPVIAEVAQRSGWGGCWFIPQGEGRGGTARTLWPLKITLCCRQWNTWACLTCVDAQW